MPDNWKQRLDITLIDIDPHALEFCQQHLTGALAEHQVETVRTNLARFPRTKSLRQTLGKSRLVYCAGFFDYLDETAAVEMLRALWSHVDDSGQLLVFNFSENNPSRAYMEWVGNWYLTYRTESSFKSLMEQANLDRCEYEIGTGSELVNLVLSCHRV